MHRKVSLLQVCKYLLSSACECLVLTSALLSLCVVRAATHTKDPNTTPVNACGILYTEWYLCSPLSTI